MRYIISFFFVLLYWTAVGVVAQLPFCMIYLPDYSIADWMEVLWHGLRLDISIAGYLTMLAGLLLTIGVWWKGRGWQWVWNISYGIVAFASSLAYVSNLVLYGYWRFPLDSTPLLYIKTSPADAMASMTTWQMIYVPLVILALAVVMFLPMAYVAVWTGGKITTKATKRRLMPRMVRSIVLLLLSALLIIPIRGGVDTGTNHTGSVYFSSDIRLNHAAVNPIFSFIESATHQEDIATRYRYLDAKEADGLLRQMTDTSLRQNAERKDYNVVLVCLEGFSKYIMAEKGHVKGVTPNLDRLTREGLYFTNVYANSFRTDRAMVAVLSGLPAQPTMSVMDMPRISTSLPSIAGSLAKHGYDTHFYYGGDANYSNMKSYLMGTGFQHVTHQFDFDKRLQTGKWGVADGPVYDRLLADIKSSDVNKRFLKVMMTGSSHEPFDVPDYHKMKQPELNAFSYADHHLGRFVEGLKKLPAWENTLVVIVPDHLGCWPEVMDNYKMWRWELPLVMLGGMIEDHQEVGTIGGQIDIPATLLAMLGLPHDEYVYSKDLMDADAPHFAFFTFPDAMGLVDSTGYTIFDNTQKNVVASSSDKSVGERAKKAKAYLQRLYDYLGSF
ncbi:MAG: sulfatase-like hydrolase/transferase [Prevotella sp.]|nr:sulfatase-like hydrolase/transferase [Prevotella sp.]